MQKSDRVSFGSKIGAILAAAGSAVGLGNIWRFPYEAEHRGGDWLDLAANTIGVLTAALVGYYVLRPIIWKKKK